MKKIITTITNGTGLHARPAAVFVKLAQKFSCKIEVATKEMKANAKSILQVISLGAVKGTEITVYLDGEDEDVAYDEILDLFIHNLYEKD